MLRTTMRKLNCVSAAALIGAQLIALSIGTVYATTIQRVDMEFLLENSGLVFEGEVLNHEATWNAEHTSISTAVSFRVRDVLKGDYSKEIITLHYAGGVVGDQGMSVSAMVYPEVGEVGIYFIEDTKQKLINPMVGWGQGHYVIEKDSAGRERVLTENRQPILEMKTESSAASGQGRQGAKHEQAFSEGTAYGIKIAERNSDLSVAMDKQDFKNTVRGKLQRMAATEER